MVTSAIPVIRTHLPAPLSSLEWTVNAYTLSFAVLPLTGATLGDRFGRRRLFTLGVAVFTAGSAAAALAPSITAINAHSDWNGPSPSRMPTCTSPSLLWGWPPA